MSLKSKQPKLFSFLLLLLLSKVIFKLTAYTLGLGELLLLLSVGMRVSGNATSPLFDGSGIFVVVMAYVAYDMHVCMRLCVVLFLAFSGSLFCWLVAVVCRCGLVNSFRFLESKAFPFWAI